MQASDEFTAITLRRLAPGDSADVHKLAIRCPDAAQWEEAAYRGIGANGMEGWGAFRDAALCGFIIVRAVADEMEILNLAVHPELRRRGIASKLAAEAFHGSGAKDVMRVFLEVRESNSVAREFYSSHGFVIRGQRARYYSDPAEDALVLVRTAQ